jgi:hypothetical protein
MVAPHGISYHCRRILPILTWSDSGFVVGQGRTAGSRQRRRRDDGSGASATKSSSTAQELIETELARRVGIEL